MAKLPIGASIRHYSDIVASGESNIFFSFDRCYLSEGVYDNPVMTVDDQTEPRFDLMNEFLFYGHYLVGADANSNFFHPSSAEIAGNLVQTVNQFQETERLGCVQGLLPGALITTVVDGDRHGRLRSLNLLPVPQWEAELNATI